MRAEDLRSDEIVSRNARTGFPQIGPHRIIMLGMGALVRLANDLNHILGQEKMDVVLARFGYEYGLGTALAIAELYEFNSPEEWLRAGGVLRRLAGTAREEITWITFDQAQQRLHFKGIWEDSFEVANYFANHAEESSRPVCTILAGAASGYATAVLGRAVLIREIECRACGAQACVFEGRTVEDWGLDPDAVKERFAVNSVKNELASLKAAIQQAHIDMARQDAEIRHLKHQHARQEATLGIVCRSEAMARVLELARKVAPTGSTVLVQGESGTGKERVARYIHDCSGRGDQPFVAVNCAALPPNLLESELFGHVKGAFTGADSDKKGLLTEAGTGTFFLDEVGELPLDLQAKLLRVLQEKEVRPVGGVKRLPLHARIVAATNRDLNEMVAEKLFREDLYYRLAVFPLVVAPLHQRRQDILLLARHFLKSLQPDHPGFAPETVRKMEHYSWPGNVRELENSVEYAAIMAGKERILPEHLPRTMEWAAANSLVDMATDLPTQRELEKRYTRLVLEKTGGCKAATARILGISVTTLWRRLKDASETPGRVVP